VQPSHIDEQKAKSLSNEKDNENSLKNASKAIRLDPSDGKKHFMRGQIHSGMENHGEALADYSEAIRLDPSSAEYYFWRGLTHCALGAENETAIDDLEEALRLDPNYGPAKYFLDTIKKASDRGR